MPDGERILQAIIKGPKSKTYYSYLIMECINTLTYPYYFPPVNKVVYQPLEITVVGFAFRPFYYGLENALTIRHLWEQGTNPIIITPNNVRRGIRKFGRGNYGVLHIRRDLFFGYDFVQSSGSWVPVSDYEKTLIDFIYFNHYLRRDVLKALRHRIDKRRLVSYLKHYNKKIKQRVLQELK